MKDVKTRPPVVNLNISKYFDRMFKTKSMQIEPLRSDKWTFGTSVNDKE